VQVTFHLHPDGTVGLRSDAGLALDVEGSSGKAGARVIEWDGLALIGGGRDNQRWVLIEVALPA